MNDLPADVQERRASCDLLERLGAHAPTLIEGWTATDIAAHLLPRERAPVRLRTPGRSAGRGDRAG